MSRKTSHSELYEALGAVVSSATGRKWWKRAGIKNQPQGPYATIYINSGVGLEMPVVENVSVKDDEDVAFKQSPWGTLLLDCVITFIRSASNDTAIVAANRMRNALYLEEQYYSLWEIAGLVGQVRILDISAAFREDIEPRAEIRFSVYANIAEDDPLSGINITDIQSEGVTVTHVGLDGQETDVQLNVDK